MHAHRVPVLAVLAIVLGAAPASPALAEPGAASRGQTEFAGETATGTQLWTVWHDGTHLRQITRVAGAATQPDWSPDGRTIMFEWDLPNERGARIGVVDTDGQHLRYLPKSAAGLPRRRGERRRPAERYRRGKRVVYERFDCEHHNDALFARSLDGSELRRITAGRPDGASEPNAAPDGRQLSFVRFDKGVEYQQALTVSDLDGGHQHDLVPPSVDVAVKTGWSPNSSRIVFTRDANPDPGTGVLQANIATVAADGSGPRSDPAPARRRHAGGAQSGEIR